MGNFSLCTPNPTDGTSGSTVFIGRWFENIASRKKASQFGKELDVSDKVYDATTTSSKVEGRESADIFLEVGTVGMTCEDRNSFSLIALSAEGLS